MHNALSLENLEMPDLSKPCMDGESHILPAGEHRTEKRMIDYICGCVPFPMEGASAGKWRAMQFKILCRIFDAPSKRDAGDKWMSFGPWNPELIDLVVNDARSNGYADWLPEKALSIYKARHGDIQ